jgi:hypothetical protein
MVSLCCVIDRCLLRDRFSTARGGLICRLFLVRRGRLIGLL